VPFDLKRRAIRGNPVGVIEGVVTKASGAVSAHMAADGSLVYVAGTASTARRSLVWVDRQGREEEIKVPPRTYAYARLSPDGRRIALDIRDEQNDVWTWDIARNTLTRLTFNPGLDRGPIWTADGTRLAVSTATAGAEAVFVRRPMAAARRRGSRRKRVCISRWRSPRTANTCWSATPPFRRTTS
jgi:Tol biopolymer transport system component